MHDSVPWWSKVASQRVQELCVTERHVDMETLVKGSLVRQRRRAGSGQVMDGKV